MNKKIKSIFLFAFHPLVIYALIVYLSCLTHESNELVYNEMPFVGDNFKTLHNPSVYYFNGQGKLHYSSIDCYKSKGNPEFGTAYEMGGIKIVTEEINNQIPNLGKLCDDNNSKEIITLKPQKLPPITYFLDKNVMLNHFSNIAHLCCYFIFGISLMNYFQYSNKKEIYTFGFSLVGGIALEIIQGLFILGRNASFMDVCLNQIGCLIGILFFIFYTKHIKTANY